MGTTPAQMDELIERHLAAEAAGDVDGAIAVYTDDVEHDVVGSPTGVAHGREGARGFYEYLVGNIKTETTVGKVFIDHCIERHIAGQLDTVTASMAKTWATDMLGKVTDRCLRPADLFLGRLSITLLPKRHRVRKSMIADPVALAVGPRRKPAALRVAELFADHEEGRPDAAFA